MSGSVAEQIDIPTSLISMSEQEAVESVISPREEFEKEYSKPVCFILAKKQSQRLPGKNSLVIAGKPLFLYAIEAAKKSEIFSNVILSSDDMDMLEQAYEAKALIHKRTKELCRPKVQMKKVVEFLVQLYQSGVFCVMTPSNPFVTPEDLQTGYARMIEKDANYVMSVTKGRPVENVITVGKDGFIRPKYNLKRSQDTTPSYYADGGFIFAKTVVFFEEIEYGFYGSKCALYETPHVNVDIDTEEDYLYAKYLMESNKSDCNCGSCVAGSDSCKTLPGN